jgi:hypothetical protein
LGREDLEAASDLLFEERFTALMPSNRFGLELGN